MKSLEDISWKVTEEKYRADEALSYSTLARFDREGFNNLDKLFDKIETPSLTFGSAVDSIITGGMDEFNERFIVLTFPPISDALKQIATLLFSRYNLVHRSLDTMSDEDLAQVGAECDFYANDKYRNYRVKLIREGCNEYYKLMFASQGKTILDNETYQEVCNAVRALRESESTRDYFADNNPFDGIERCYQLKFKATLDNVNYRCMADCLYTNFNDKTITPIDLKTSSHTEWDFYKSFVEWRYFHQARLYYRIIRANMDKDPYFKDFTLNNYKFIVVNKKTLIPLVWEYADTKTKGTLFYGKNNQIEVRDPEDIGKQLNYYLSSRPIVPNGIKINESNSLNEWLKTL